MKISPLCAPFYLFLMAIFSLDGIVAARHRVCLGPRLQSPISRLLEHISTFRSIRFNLKMLFAAFGYELRHMATPVDYFDDTFWDQAESLCTNTDTQEFEIAFNKLGRLRRILQTNRRLSAHVRGVLCHLGIHVRDSSRQVFLSEVGIRFKETSHSSRMIVTVKMNRDYLKQEREQSPHCFDSQYEQK